MTTATATVNYCDHYHVVATATCDCDDSDDDDDDDDDDEDCHDDTPTVRRGRFLRGFLHMQQ